MIARVVWNWLHLRHNQWLPRNELEELQFKKLKTIVTYAYEKVPFYRRFYDKHDVHPDQLRKLDHIQRFPIISKELARDVPLEDRTAVGTNVSGCTLKTTSGSTGVPVAVLEDEHSIDYLDAYHLRRLFEYTYRPWQKILRLTIEPPGKESPGAAGEARAGLMKRLRESQVKRLAISDDIDKHLEIMKNVRPDFIVGPPSYLKGVANIISERGITNIRPRALITWGEVLDDVSRSYLTSNFGSEVYDGYGCTEVAPVGGLAWECKERTGLHMNMDVSYLEFLKDGEPVSPGEKGEVIATSLFRFATPMIRYKVGDLVTLSDEICPCGREMPLIKNIEGRLVDLLRLPNGRLISPYAVMVAVQDIRGIAKFQVVQESQNNIVATIEKGKEFSQNTISQLTDAGLRLFGPEIGFEVNVIESFPILTWRKFRAVESKLR
jgi:phenylacetate-CoA ligase